MDLPADVALIEVPVGSGDVGRGDPSAERPGAAAAVQPDHDLVGWLIAPVGVGDRVQPEVVRDVEGARARRLEAPAAADTAIGRQLYGQAGAGVLPAPMPAEHAAVERFHLIG